MILLDTHVLWWAVLGDERLGRSSRKLVDDAVAGGTVAVSAVTFWELAMLAERGRIQIPIDLASWRAEVLALGIREIPVTGSIAIVAGELRNLHGDPADRILLATAIEMKAQVVTADERILRWRNALRRYDARR